jgi:hypothetical protein
LAFAVFYLAFDTKRGIVGWTEDTPANNIKALLISIIAYETEYNVLPPSLSSLGPPSAGKEANRDAFNEIDARLASGNKNGYVYRYVPNAQSKSFFITADPSDNNGSRLHYFSDQTGVVRFESGHGASSSSPEYLRDN